MSDITKNFHKLFWYWNSFWIAMLLIYMGIGLTDAFQGGILFKKSWLIIIFICFPLFVIGSWAIKTNKKYGG